MRRRGVCAAMLAAALPPAPGHARAAEAANGRHPPDPVRRGRPLVFPRDHGAHPADRLEWWYATGWAGPMEAVQQVGGYFGKLTTLKGGFVQTSPDQKRMKGKFSVKRPGKFRFDYALPSKQVIISDGTYLAIQDLDLNNEDRVSLDQTPFRLLLRSEVDLVRDACIVEVQEADDMMVVGLRDRSPDTPGRIRLHLSKQPALELKEWVTTDAQGLATRVEVSGVEKGDEIEDGRFKINPVGMSRTGLEP
jgi:outer membrane lipoprotein-sorting protein